MNASVQTIAYMSTDYEGKENWKIQEHFKIMLINDN